jgi:hypothetical protein
MVGEGLEASSKAVPVLVEAGRAALAAPDLQSW